MLILHTPRRSRRNTGIEVCLSNLVNADEYECHFLFEMVASLGALCHCTRIIEEILETNYGSSLSNSR